MSVRYKIQMDPNTTDHLLLPCQIAEKIGGSKTGKKTLRYGNSSHLVNILISEQQESDTLVLSENIMNELMIPVSSLYELIHVEDEIRIGPFIGLLLSLTDDKFVTYLRRLEPYVNHYGKVGGTILAFCMSHVNPYKQTINGYVYNPQTKEWDQGDFGYPSSFFIMSRMIPYTCRQHFKVTMGGNTFFNNFNYDKWEMHQLLRNSKVNSYLPPTQLFEHAEQFVDFLEGNSDFYVKPLIGSRGRGVARVRKTSKGTRISYRDKGRNHQLLIQKPHELTSSVNENLSAYSYLLQKTIDLITWSGRIVDFRILMVRNQEGEWKDVGFFARCGSRGSVVSNISAGGKAHKGENFLKKELKLTNKQTNHLVRSMKQLAYDIGEILDQSDVHCGNMGVDIGLDKQGGLWILEIQHNNPDPTLALDAGDKRAYSQVLHHHLLYLKGLAGWKEQSE